MSRATAISLALLSMCLQPFSTIWSTPDFHAFPGCVYLLLPILRRSHWQNRDQEDDPEEEGEEGSSEEEESEEEEEEKHKGVAGLIAVENPNAPRKAAVKISQADTNATTQLSRREREEIEKERSKERYMKLQEQGKTEQSKKDLERLALIRQQREEAAKKKEEERLAKEAKKLEARKR
ncbi:unnamed protein product [Closterium sp. Naga37s-1]|nr:unnamed protein product [Closterium sp. Naga37s-1]